VRIVVAEDLTSCATDGPAHPKPNGHQVVATATTGPNARRAADVRPDVAVVDVRMPPTQTDEGLRAALAARVNSGMPVLILSPARRTVVCPRTLADGAGGIGYFLKESVFRRRSVHRCPGTRSRRGPPWTQRDRRTAVSGPSNRRLGRLTEREHSVLSLMAEGLFQPGHRRRLFLSVQRHPASTPPRCSANSASPMTDSNNRRVPPSSPI